nr:hypothetical protein HK105_005075 [Polyrhizophydium stewartii]
MFFFDGQPNGRLLNRMCDDITALDVSMVGQLSAVFTNVAVMLAAAFVIGFTNPILIAHIVVMVLLYAGIVLYYQSAFRDLNRLMSIMRSPLAAHVSESLVGLETIRALRVQTAFLTRQEQVMDERAVSGLLVVNARLWMLLRLGVVASTITMAVMLFGVAHLISPVMASLALASSLSLNHVLNGAFVALSDFEASFNSVERLIHYAKGLPAEAARELPAEPKDSAWPTAGAVSIRDLEIRYPSRPDHAVIQDLSLDIQPGEKVGVVGRTGSGKSTLMTALFRIMEASKGSIAIDGVDIASLGLKTLRSRLQIIPQEPVLFKGTVRSNLDFAGKYTDDELWAVLGLVGLKDFVGTLDGKLDAAVEENGANLSMGQRQLMCLCKAILAKPKVLIMDEATASVDAEADRRIQESIETQFAATTVLSIAHRLNTIAAFDRALVLDGGRIAEFDAPHVLLGRAGSVFGDMVDATGAVNAAVIRQIAAEHYAHKTKCNVIF